MILAVIMILQSVTHSQIMLGHYQTQFKILKIYAEIPEFIRGPLELILCGADRYNTDDNNTIIAKCDNCLSASNFILSHNEFTGQEQLQVADEIDLSFSLSEYNLPKWLRPLTLAPPAVLSI